MNFSYGPEEFFNVLSEFRFQVLAVKSLWSAHMAVFKINIAKEAFWD